MKPFTNFLAENEEFLNHIIKMKITQMGQKHHLDKLVDDEHYAVRSAIAVRGFKEHLDRLVHDDHPDVRMSVASHGHQDHLDKLVHDPSPEVRKVVAKKGSVANLEKLKDDPDFYVHQAIIHRGIKHINDRYIDHPDQEIRQELASTTPEESHHAKLMWDPSWQVVSSLASNNPFVSKYNLRIMAKSHDSAIEYNAKKALEQMGESAW